MRAGSQLPIARRLQEGSLTLGESFAFMSGLYFRGKLAYAQAFGRSDDGTAATWVITPSRGLMTAAALVDVALLREFAAADVSLENPAYRVPLDRDIAVLASRLPRGAEVVLLGSIATGKYIDALAPWLGDRLRFPSSFIGRGDMSRGGLLLRSVASGEELAYGPLQPGAVRRGARPPKLAPLNRSRG